jgi:phosphoenolpyruvate carboxylase
MESEPRASPMTEPDVRQEDIPLHEDVRRLGDALGRVIERLEGKQAFELVDSLRKNCRARRRNEPGAPDLAKLIEDASSLPLDLASIVARAFTLFFLLINTAEQVHRVRRRNAYATDENASPQPASTQWTMQRLRELGYSAEAVAASVSGLHVRPVLTAHPTESTRRTLLALQARVADLLLSRSVVASTDRRDIDESLDAEVELLWLTSEVRQDRPTVRDEVSTVLWYFETRLLDAAAHATDAMSRAFSDVFGESESRDAVPSIRIGTWVGGDRDGNPFVTPAETLAASRRASYAILGTYQDVVADLVRRLSVSSQIASSDDELGASFEGDRQLLPHIWEMNWKRNEDEPIRLKLTFIEARIAATRELVASRDAGNADAQIGAAYPDASTLAADLELIRKSLDSAHAQFSRRRLLDPLIASVSSHGFHGMMMDIRDHADSHRAALDEIAVSAGISITPDNLRKELLGTRPFVNEHSRLSDETARVLGTFRAIATIQRESGEKGACTYIVSMTQSADDLLRVLMFARETGLADLSGETPSSAIDVVPLFETLDDLQNAPDIMKSLLADEAYRRQLQARGNLQEVMIGYSDSNKDAGIFASSWGLYRVQESLARIFRDAGIRLRIFHGRGGSVGRGGGSPVYRALSALPPGTVDGSIKITEQGEIISQQFGLLPIAERTLEVTLSGVLLQELTDWRDGVDDSEVAIFRETMEVLSSRSFEVYKQFVHDDERVFAMFEQASPIEELASARFGSRPAYRPGSGSGITGIRAIPWVFGWTQNRLMLPGWLGVGTALSEIAEEKDGLETLRRMARTWPFFGDLLARIDMVCAKADIEIARAYVERLGGDKELLETLIEEFDRTVAAILRVRDTQELLSDNDVLSAAITLRNPYVDALSVLQIAQLARKRTIAREESADLDVVESILATTVSGIAQGLRNTG